MALHTKITNIVSESTMRPTSASSPLRKKSMPAPGLTPSPNQAILPENDDEVERLARRQEIETFAKTSRTVNTSSRRSSLGLGSLVQMSVLEMADHISQCIQMNAENKINIKNAFSLEIIDFMTYLTKKHDSNMSNLQLATTSLDVSAKVYGYRVDGVHRELLKMTGTVEKEDQEGTGQKEDFVEEQDDHRAQQQKKKQLKKNKKKVFASVAALKGNIERCKPSLLIMKDDAQTTDTLLQAMLPNHCTSGYYLHNYNDIIVDTVDQKKVYDKNSLCTIPRIDDLSDLELCTPLSAFEFHSWTEENDIDDAEPEVSNEELQFDLDASLPADNDTSIPMTNYFDSNHMDGEDENVVACARAPNEVQNIVDFRQVVTAAASEKSSEYSYIQKSLNIHWAGPSHWKLGNIGRTLGNSKIMGACPQTGTKKRKGIEISYDESKLELVQEKFVHGNATKLQSKTAKLDWNEGILTLPRDMYYDIANASALYLHKLFTVKDNTLEDLNTTHLSDELDNYDYNNENDTSNYCPNTVQDDFNANDEPNFATDHSDDANGQLSDHIGFTGENLVAAPKLANKIPLTYSVRAKRIDMRQLKKCIWKSLVGSSNKEDIEKQEPTEAALSEKMKTQVKFGEVCKSLPNVLTKSNADALSFPIAFVSLLHLANEKKLTLASVDDMSDIIVSQD